MAPEMLSMLDEDYDLYPEGYSQCVDWWSFGVTVMELLSGFNPMKHVDLTPSFGSDKSSHHLPLPNNMFDNALDKFCNYETISFAAKHMVRQFLALDASCRLGAGRTGVDRIKNHMFFQCIDWDQLEQGHVMPPYFPEVKVAEAMQVSTTTNIHILLRCTVINTGIHEYVYYYTPHITTQHTHQCIYHYVAFFL